MSVLNHLKDNKKRYLTGGAALGTGVATQIALNKASSSYGKRLDAAEGNSIQVSNPDNNLRIERFKPKQDNSPEYDVNKDLDRLKRAAPKQDNSPEYDVNKDLVRLKDTQGTSLADDINNLIEKPNVINKPFDLDSRYNSYAGYLNNEAKQKAEASRLESNNIMDDIEKSLSSDGADPVPDNTSISDMLDRNAERFGIPRDELLSSLGINENTSIRKGIAVGAGVGAGAHLATNPVITTNTKALFNNLHNILSSGKEVGEKAEMSKLALLASKENIRNWLPTGDNPDGGVYGGLQLATESLSNISLVIEEGITDWISRNPTKAVVGAGAIGTGLATGHIQKGIKHLIKTSPKDVVGQMKQGVGDFFDKHRDTTAGEATDAAKEGLSNITEKISEVFQEADASSADASSQLSSDSVTSTHTPTSLDTLLGDGPTSDKSIGADQTPSLGGAESQPEVTPGSGIIDANYNPNQDTAVETIGDIIKHQGFFDRYSEILNV